MKFSIRKIIFFNIKGHVSYQLFSIFDQILTYTDHANITHISFDPSNINLVVGDFSFCFKFL